MHKQLCFEKQLCPFPACPAGVSVMLKTHHWEENISFTVTLKGRSKNTDTCFLFHVTPKQTAFMVLLSVLYLMLIPFSFVPFCLVFTECILWLCTLPGHQKENTADSQVGQKHEEPHSRREGIQEGEVARSTSLKHTITQRLDHEKACSG